MKKEESYTENKRKQTRGNSTEDNLKKRKILIDKDMKKERSKENQCITSNNYTTHSKKINKSFIILYQKKKDIEKYTIKITAKSICYNS